jgi:ATPase subunit of ABC transporter with duplicated ATPase domains
LSSLLFSHPSALVLDEPTNHLDITAREALEDALRRFQGTVILISHDRFLIDRVATEVWNVDDGTLEVFDGNWSDFAAGRYKRGLTYSEIRARHAEPHVPSPEIFLRLAKSQERLSTVAGRLVSISSTASVDQLEELTEQYSDAQNELFSLAESWLPDRS